MKLSSTSIGIDIGSDCLKIVCLGKKDEGYLLQSYGFLKHGGDEDSIKSLLKEARLSAGNIRVNIEDPSLKIRRVNLPPMEPAEVGEAIQWGMKDYIDGDVDDFSFRYMLLDKEDVSVEGKLPVIGFAIKAAAIDEKISYLHKLGIGKVNVIESESAALNNVFLTNRKIESEGNELLLNIGSHFSLMTVMGKKGFLFSRPVECCMGTDFIDEIVKAMNCDRAHAGEFAMEYCIKGRLSLEEVENEQFKEAISACFSKLAIEIQRAIDGFSLVFQGSGVSKISISGGGACLIGLSQYIEQTLNIKSEIFDPFACVDISLFNDGRLDKIKPMFAVACGLAFD